MNMHFLNDEPRRKICMLGGLLEEILPLIKEVCSLPLTKFLGFLLPVLLAGNSECSGSKILAFLEVISASLIEFVTLYVTVE